jgi:CheY-like chemotaxis protein
LLDLSLPIVSGWQAPGELKADPLTSRIPVIALTAHSMSGDHERALAAGCDDYDTKQIEFVQLLEKIDALLAREPGSTRE